MTEQTTVASFHIIAKRCIDADGVVHGDLPEFARDREHMAALYRLMLLTRKFDEKAVALQRTGQLGTFASSLGEEASTVAIGAALQHDDVLLPSFREQGAMLARGVTPAELFLFWGGDERGSDFQGPRLDFPICIPVGSHASHAAGVALAFKLRKQPRVAVCVFGDGATSKGDVYEAMNLAGAWQLPVLFVVLNNHWAISVPRSAQSGAETLAQKAIAAGFEGIQVDGNDVVAAHETVLDALAYCRNSCRPLLIEALTYRLTDHTTSDDAGRYRDEQEVSQRWREDPVARCREFLVRQFEWTREEEEQLIEAVAEQVESAADDYLKSSAQSPQSQFDYLYASLPEALYWQRAQLQGNNDEPVR